MVTDLNIGATVTDGGGNRTYGSPNKANDANDGTAAQTNAGMVGAGTYTGRLVSDLGSAQTVASMSILGAVGSGGIAANPAWSVEYASAPTGPWTAVTGFVGAYTNPPATTLCTFDPISARYWRISGGATYGSGLHYMPNFYVWTWAIYADDTPPAPPPPPGVKVTINGIEFENPKELTIRNELNAAGQMTLVLDRNDVQATRVNLTNGSICTVTFTEIDPDPIAAFILESGDWDLISSDEEGGEELRYTGPGVMWLLHRAVVAFEEYEPSITAGAVYPNRGRWEFGDSIKAGRIIHKLVSEALSSSRPQAPLAGVTIDFTASVDSNGDAWTETFDGRWRTPIGRNLYGEIQRIAVAGGLSMEMGPDLVLHVYNSRGTDRSGSAFGTGVIRFAKGVNIADELTRSQNGRGFVSHGQVHWGDDGDYGWITKSGSWPFVQEAPYDENTDNHTTANRAARAKMGWKERAQDAPGFAHKVPWPGDGNDEANGVYLPGPSWTENGLYWLGDTITLHTGTAELDYDEQDGIVYAITLMLDQTGFLAPPVVELNAPFGASEASSPSTSVVGNQVSSSGSSGGGTDGGGTILPGLYELAVEGGDPVVMAHGSTGAAETIDPSDGNVHTLTLDADCTFTINPPTGVAATLELWITQDGTGGWDITWPGSVTVQGTLDTTASTTSRVILDTVDTGTTWIATVVGAGGGGGPTTAADVTLVDAGGNYTSTDLEALSQEQASLFVWAIGGGKETVEAHGSAGTTETINLTDGNVHTLTLDSTSCALSLSGATGGKACGVTVLLTQDGTGGRVVTWPVSVVWPGGMAPVLSTGADVTDVITLLTVDGGTTWYGFYGATPLAIGDTVVSEVTFGQAPDPGNTGFASDAGHTHGTPDDPGTGGGGGTAGFLLIADVHSSPIVFADIMQADDYSDLLYSEA